MNPDLLVWFGIVGVSAICLVCIVALVPLGISAWLDVLDKIEDRKVSR